MQKHDEVFVDDSQFINKWMEAGEEKAADKAMNNRLESLFPDSRGKCIYKKAHAG